MFHVKRKTHGFTKKSYLPFIYLTFNSKKNTHAPHSPDAQHINTHYRAKKSTSTTKKSINDNLKQMFNRQH